MAAVAPRAATVPAPTSVISSKASVATPVNTPRAAGPTNANGYNQFPDPEAQGINPSVEINRIQTNIMIYNGVIAAAAIGIGVTMCLFVRSVLSPAKGYHGGDSDGDMDSEDEDESGSEED